MINIDAKRKKGYSILNKKTRRGKYNEYREEVEQIKRDDDIRKK